MRPRHVTQHTTRQRGDALDLLVEQSALLQALFHEWRTTTPKTADAEQAVPTNWDRGTIGKLVLEHAAVWLAAREEIVRVLRDCGAEELAARLTESSELARRLIDRLHEASAGVQPMSLAVSPGYAALMDEFERKFGGQLADEAGLSSELTAALGDRRSLLRDGKFLRRHAPTHPGPATRVKRIPVISRLHTLYDRARGIPWAESYPQANTKLAARYDRDKT